MTKQMRTKILVAIILIACVVPPFLLGGIAMEILVAAITALASVEIASLEDGKRHYLMSIIIFAATELMAHVPDAYVPAVFGIWLTFMFCCDIASPNISTDRIAYTFIMTVVLVLAWHAVWRIYKTGFNGLGMLFAAIACYACDTGAYFFGVFMGKHKMNPRISPHKTWEGAIGGYLCGAVLSLVWGFLVQQKFAAVPIPSSLIIAAGLILPLIAEIGDLSFSAIKRRWGIKDYGSLLPGHGGILDRVDSLLFCLMAFNTMMLLWGF